METASDSAMSRKEGAVRNEKEPIVSVHEPQLPSSDVSMAVDSQSKDARSSIEYSITEPGMAEPTMNNKAAPRDVIAEDVPMNETQTTNEDTGTTAALVDALADEVNSNAPTLARPNNLQTEEAPTSPEHAPVSELDRAILNAEAGMEPAKPAAVEFSDLESESSESDSSSDSDSSSVSPRKRMTSKEREEILIKFDEMDEEDGPKEPTVPHTKNEVLVAPVKKPEVEITPDMELQEIGTVSNIVDNVVVVQANVDGDYQVLDSESVLVFPDRTVLGLVFETFGAVKQPMYSVRFNTAEEIDKEIVQIGKKVCHVPQYSHFVFTMALRALKGSDASNRYDEEPAEEEIEFSDDEQEMAHKRRIKAARKGRGSVVPSDAGSSYAPSVAGATDDEGDGYTVLERPSYGQAQGQGQGHRDMPPPRSRGRNHHGDSRAGTGSYHGDRRSRGGGRDRGQRTEPYRQERPPQQYFSQQHFSQQQQQYQYPYQQSQSYPQQSYQQQYSQQTYQQQWQGASAWPQPPQQSAHWSQQSQSQPQPPPPPQQWSQQSYQQYHNGWGYQQAYASASTRQPHAIDLIQEQLLHLQELQRQQQLGSSPGPGPSAPPS